MIPGGHLDLGEKVEQALKREIKEETSLNIYSLKFLNFREAVFDKHGWNNRHLIFFNYIAKTGSLDVKLNSEAQEYCWVSLDEALRLPLLTYTRKTIEDYKSS